MMNKGEIETEQDRMCDPFFTLSLPPPTPTRLPPAAVQSRHFYVPCFTSCYCCMSHIYPKISRMRWVTNWDSRLCCHRRLSPHPLYTEESLKRKLWDFVANYQLDLKSYITSVQFTKRIFFFNVWCSLGPVLFPFISSTFFSHVKMLPSSFCPHTPLPLPQPYQSQKKQLLSICPDYSENQNRTHYVIEQHSLHFMRCLLRTVAVYGEPAPAGLNSFSC